MKIKVQDIVYRANVREVRERVIRVADFAIPSDKIAASLATVAGQIPISLGPASWDVLAAPTSNGLSPISDLSLASKWKLASSGMSNPQMINNSGGDLNAGSVVIADPAANSFITTTTEGDAVIGVLGETIANGVAGSVWQVGLATVLVQGNVAIGDKLCSSTTAGRAKTATTYQGVFGIATTAYAGGGAGSVTALILVQGKLADIGTNTHAQIDTALTLFPNRNAIINGAMDIWQRGTTTLTNPVTATYFPDRFKTTHVLGDGTFDLLASAETPTAAFPFQFSLQHDTTHIETAVAAGEYSLFDYKIEGYDFKRFEGQVATLSFWVKAVKAGIYCVSFRNNAANKSYIHEFTCAANTWEKKTVTLTFNSGGTFLYTTGIGLSITWAIMAGSTFQIATANKNTWQAGNYFATDAQVNGMDNVANNFFLTGVQMELGSVVTPFEFRLFAQELNLCQRYFERIQPLVAYQMIASGFATATTNGAFCLQYRTKRTSPTFTWTAGNTFTINNGADQVTATSAVAINGGRVGTESANVHATVAAVLNVGDGCTFNAGVTAASCYINISAEL